MHAAVACEDRGEPLPEIGKLRIRERAVAEFVAVIAAEIVGIENDRHALGRRVIHDALHVSEVCRIERPRQRRLHPLPLERKPQCQYAFALVVIDLAMGRNKIIRPRHAGKYCTEAQTR